jgi:hypothetical protein
LAPRFACYLVLWASALACGVIACAATVPKAVLDRCTLGNADGNDAFTMRQGPACGEAAADLEADKEMTEAIAYARKACSLQDARGCELYLSLARTQPSLSAEIPNARAAGEGACAGMVVASGGVDARPLLCARTAQLYLDVEPKSPREAGRLYARACDLGDEASCERAKSLGIVTATPPPAPTPMAVPPAPTRTPPPARVPTCHELRECVALDVQQRNTTEVLGTLTNHCNRAAFCSFCPVRQGIVDRGACRTVTIAPNESKSGREAGLWYDGYTAIAYDCSDAQDDRSCTP